MYLALLKGFLACVQGASGLRGLRVELQGVVCVYTSPLHTLCFHLCLLITGTFRVLFILNPPFMPMSEGAA